DSVMCIGCTNPSETEPSVWLDRQTARRLPDEPLAGPGRSPRLPPGRQRQGRVSLAGPTLSPFQDGGESPERNGEGDGSKSRVGKRLARLIHRRRCLIRQASLSFPPADAAKRWVPGRRVLFDPGFAPQRAMRRLASFAGARFRIATDTKPFKQAL